MHNEASHKKQVIKVTKAKYGKYYLDEFKSPKVIIFNDKIGFSMLKQAEKCRNYDIH